MFDTSLKFASSILIVLIQLNIVREPKIIKPTEMGNFCCEVELVRELDLMGASSRTFLKPIPRLFQIIYFSGSMMFAKFRMGEFRILVSK